MVGARWPDSIPPSPVPALIGASARNTALGRVSNGLSRVVGRLTDPVERALARPAPDVLAFPPVFIVGAPRTGSTALYQLIADHFDVGYLTNLHCWFHGMPSVVERWIADGARDGVAYESSYGTTEGWLAPSECGAFWYRFFPRRPHYVEHLTASTSQDLRRVVGRLGDAFGKPVLFKNMNAGLRIRPLTRALPEAVFVWIRRDTADAAYSILQARRALTGSVESWWSIEPPGIEAIRRLPYAAQAVEQVRGIDRAIADGLTEVPASRQMTVDYEALCADPLAVLAEVAETLAAAGIRTDRITPVNPPSVRASRQTRRAVDIDWQCVVDYAS